MPHRIIMLVDDDAEDRELFEDTMNLLQVKHRRLYFNDADSAFDYLSNTSDEMYIIFSDINMPGCDGLEFKRKIDEDKRLKIKAIPFVFFTTANNRQSINEAYKSMTIQGYFQKPYNAQQYKGTVSTILDYWKHCERPSF